MAGLPRLSFSERYEPDYYTGELAPGERKRSPLMTPLIPRSDLSVRFLSDVAKDNDVTGQPEHGYYRTFANVEVAQILIGQYQHRTPESSAPASAFPYALKATGFINPYEIMRHQQDKGYFVSDDVRIIP